MKGFAAVIFSKDIKLRLSTRKAWQRGALALKAVFFPQRATFLVRKWFKAYLPLVAPLSSQES